MNWIIGLYLDLLYIILIDLLCNVFILLKLSPLSNTLSISLLIFSQYSSLY